MSYKLGIHTPLFRAHNTTKQTGVRNGSKFPLASFYGCVGDSYNVFFEKALVEKNKNFVFAGFTTHHIYLFLSQYVPNVEFLGKADYDSMPEIYNKYEILFYEPNLREPFCRTVAEAYLCGMKIETSKKDKIGSLLEIEKIGIKEFSKRCNSAAKTFWEKI